MAFPGKAVLFVEGEITPRPRLPEPLSTIWQRHLVTSLGLIDIDRVVGINKKNLLVMEPTQVNKKQLSGTGMVGLDQRIAAELERDQFDVAVIAWDLQPPDPSAPTCRWEEVLKLYRGLSESQALPSDPWRRWAKSRYDALSKRKKRRNPNPPVLETGAVLAVCMEPTFESLLVVCEQTIKRTLGVKDRGRVKWPNWDKHRQRPEDLLQLAIKAAQDVHPKPRAVTRVWGDMKTAKHEWGEYLLRHMIADEQCLEELKQHPTAARLIGLLSKER